MRMPAYVSTIFWESVPKYSKNDQYIVERIMDFGDTKQVKWMRQNYVDSKLKKFLKNSRVLSPKSANYWSLKLDIKPEIVKCLKKTFLGKQNRFI